ncbi:MAG: hypothetical protein AB8G15_17750 [Saprospiraceae bacterium]
MKTLKSSVSFCLLVLAMFLTTTTFANSSTPKELSPKQSLKKRVLSLLDKPELADHGIEKATVTIEFKINENNRIELSDIGTEDEYLKNYLNRCLQKEKAFVEDLEKGTTHSLTLIFISE